GDTAAPAGGGGGGGGGAANGGGGGDGGAAAPGGSPGPAIVGFWDRDYDYTQHRRFRFVYMVSSPGGIFDMFNETFATWADRLNMEFSGLWAPANAGDAEEFLTAIEMHALMGYDGIIFDSDPFLAPRIADIVSGFDLEWMFMMAQPRDFGNSFTVQGQYVPGRLLAPFVGFNDLLVGQMMANQLIDWYEREFSHVPVERVGKISIAWSTAVQLNMRSVGAEMVWAERFPQFGEFHPDTAVNPQNFFVSDLALVGADPMLLITTELSTNPDIDVWLISTMFGSQAIEAAVIVDDLGMNDVVCIVSFAVGPVIVEQWEAGVRNSFRYALESIGAVWTELVINALWAFMAGFASPETIWEDWRVVWDKGDLLRFTGDLDAFHMVPVAEMDDNDRPIVLEEHNFPIMFLPIVWVTPENFEQYFAFLDLYSIGPDATEEERAWPQFPMVYDMDLFPTRIDPPRTHHTWPNDW
ncbi:MAG: hypothetical protein FWB97_04035, partial [Oscillospiraceae bacterium]|nr:hypothetical protein [Oscillospiraceae bacterium]